MPKPSAVDKLMASHGLTREQAQAALAEAKAATLAKRAQQATEVIPAPPAHDWSLADPATTDRVVAAVIKHGEYDAARAAIGCPEDVFSEVISDPGFMAKLKGAAGLAMIPKIIKAAPAFIEESAYGADKMAQIFKALGSDEAQEQQARQLKTGGLRARLKALENIIKEAARQYEVLTGGHRPLPAELDEIVRAVSQQEKSASAA